MYQVTLQGMLNYSLSFFFLIIIIVWLFYYDVATMLSLVKS